MLRTAACASFASPGGTVRAEKGNKCSAMAQPLWDLWDMTVEGIPSIGQPPTISEVRVVVTWLSWENGSRDVTVVGKRWDPLGDEYPTLPAR